MKVSANNPTTTHILTVDKNQIKAKHETTNNFISDISPILNFICSGNFFKIESS